MNARYWIISGAGLFVTGLVIAAVRVILAFRQLDLPGGPDPHRISVPSGLPMAMALTGVIIGIIGGILIKEATELGISEAWMEKWTRRL